MEFCLCTCTICGVVILLAFVMLYSAAARKKYSVKGKHVLVSSIILNYSQDYYY